MGHASGRLALLSQGWFVLPAGRALIPAPRAEEGCSFPVRWRGPAVLSWARGQRPVSKARKVGVGGARGLLRRGWPRGQCLETGGRPHLARGTSEVGLPGCVLGVVASRSSTWPWGWRGLWGAGGALNPILSPSLLPSLPPSRPSPGPLRSMVEDLQSEESDEDDSSSGEEAAGKTNAGRDSRCLGRQGGVSGPGRTGAALPGPAVIVGPPGGGPGRGLPRVRQREPLSPPGGALPRH